MKRYRAVAPFLGVLALISWWNHAEAQTLAFPGAEGFGRFAKGGRGGKVIEVTNLNDSGAGSLRACAEASGPRTCIFRVGGTINLQTPIKIVNGFLTIAGQTAPGDGVMIRGGGGDPGDGVIWVLAQEVIIRYIRVRPGADGAKRGLQVARPEFDSCTCNVIIDHCSMSWASDNITGAKGSSSGNNTRNVTFQWNLISESIGFGSKGVHFAPFATNISFHHNFVGQTYQRNPMIQSNDAVDVVNNVIYDYAHSGARVRTMQSDDPAGRYPYPAHANLVGNYYKVGLSAADETRSPSNFEPDIHLMGNMPATPESGVYLEDNVKDKNGSTSPLIPTHDLSGDDAGTGPIPIMNTRFLYPLVTTRDAVSNVSEVIQKAGATLPRRDPIDTRIINNFLNGTGMTVLSSEMEVGGYPVYKSGTPPADTDHDGMPDGWENANGLNPSDPSNGPADADGDGYTNLEEYLNSLTGVVGDTAPPSAPANLLIMG